MRIVLSPLTWSVCATVNEPQYVIERFVNHYTIMGASQICLFLDVEDLTLESWLKSLKNVLVFPRAFQSTFNHPANRSHERKQCIHYQYFLEQFCQTDWSGHVDADELIIDPRNGRSFGDYLSALDGAVQALRLMPAESIFSPRDNIMCPFSGSIARTRAVPFEKYEDAMRTIYGDAAPMLFHGLAGHVKGKTFIRRINTIGRVGLHGVGEEDKVHELIDWKNGFLLLHYDAICFQHWERKWSLRLGGHVRMTGMSDKRNLQLNYFRDCGEDFNKRSDLFRSIYALTREQIELLEDLNMLVKLSESSKVLPMLEHQKSGI